MNFILKRMSSNYLEINLNEEDILLEEINLVIEKYCVFCHRFELKLKLYDFISGK